MTDWLAADIPQPLLSTWRNQWTPRTLLAWVNMPGRAIRRRLVDWISHHVDHEASLNLLKQGLAEPQTRAAVLDLWQDDALPLPDNAGELLQATIRDPDRRVRQAAVDVIVRRRPDLAAAVLQVPCCAQDPVLWNRLCLSEDSGLILPLLAAIGFPHRYPPPAVGLLVTSAWLAESESTAPDVVAWLARECGYCDEELNSDVRQQLAQGFSYGAEVLGTGEDLHQHRERVRSLTWQLVTDGDDWRRCDSRPLDVADPVERACFLAAVRDADRLLSRERRRQPSWQQAEPVAVCHHAPIRHTIPRFFQGPIALADQLGVPAGDRGAFALDHARVALETDPESQTAADCEMRTRWRMRQTPECRAPEQLILGTLRPGPSLLELSPGARSICCLAEFAGWPVAGLADWLSDCEARWSRSMVPIGMELQIPGVSRNAFGAWKAALPVLGIPSPPRREFGGVVEASFRPVSAPVALLLAARLLHRVGLISRTSAQQLTMHLSLNGDLGSRVRLIAFPQLFLHASHRPQDRPAWAMTRVMSKGLVHRATDAESMSCGLFPAGNPIRTEIRVYRVFSELEQESTRILETDIDDILTVSLVGSAMLGACSECAALMEDYEQAMQGFVTTLPGVFQTLYDCDFRESTGEPRDPELMAALPIYQAWRAVRREVRARDLALTLARQFGELRGALLRRLMGHFQAAHGIDAAGDRDWILGWYRRDP